LPPYPGDPGLSADSTANTTTSSSKDPLDDPASILAKRSIYFDLDSYVVKDEFKPVIEAHAKYLISRKDRKIIIQGNTDERGGSEYNLALGQKRSEAVRRALQLLGVSDTQMEAISLGKEKPKATGSGEKAWAENRRADIVY
jgi:peptidoglycan-associated lipoprotein